MSSGQFEYDEQRPCFRPAPPILPRLEDIQEPLQRAIAKVSEFDRLLSEWPREGAIGRLFARLDAVHSAGAEGATTTFTELMEFKTSARRAPDPADAASVAACADALEAEPSGNLIDLALKLHRKLFERSSKPLDKTSAGKWKDRWNATQDGSSPDGFFYFTKPASIEPTLIEWQRFTMADDRRSPEILRQIASHWMFEHIHPFHDGNGRVGRLLVPLTLKLKGATKTSCAFFGEAVFDNKDAYTEALKAARLTSDWTAYARLMLAMIAQTAENNIARLHELKAIEMGWTNKLRGFRKDARVHIVARFALTNPAFTIADVKRHTGGTYANNNIAADKLVQAGILALPGNKRGRIFHAADVLDIFDRLQAPHPSP
jgi:Fic family protein